MLTGDWGSVGGLGGFGALGEYERGEKLLSTWDCGYVTTIEPMKAAAR